MEIVLEARGLRKVYRQDGVAVEALRGVDLQVRRGEFVAIMGPSGSGKSTLLHLLGGLERPTGGEVWLEGERIDRLGEAARARLRRRRIGFVFQSYNLIPNLTAADNVDLVGLLAGQSRREVARRRQALFEALGVAGRARAFPGELSGGEQQRVALARALVNGPTLLLADEPTGNLDSRSGAAVLELLRRFHAEGQTILLVTHDPRVASFAERVLFLQDGRIVDQVTLDTPGDRRLLVRHLVQLEV